MTSDEERTLLKAVTDHPKDDIPRLAYADWCDRRGDPRGKFIRVQIELAQVIENRDDPTRRPLLKESRTLLAHHGGEWSPRNSDIIEFAYSRGFVADVTLSADAFLEHAETLYSQFPIQHARIRNISGKSLAVLTSSAFMQLSAATLTRGALTDDDIKALAQSPFAVNLWWLDLGYNQIGKAGVEAMITSRYLKKLGYVNLAGNPCNPIETASFDQGALMDTQLPESGEDLIARFGPIKWLEFRDCGPFHPDGRR